MSNEFILVRQRDRSYINGAIECFRYGNPGSILLYSLASLSFSACTPRPVRRADGRAKAAQVHKAHKLDVVHARSCSSRVCPYISCPLTEVELPEVVEPPPAVVASEHEQLRRSNRPKVAIRRKGGSE